ncbi:MAG: cellulose binding domain-containing protein, partial [Microthrixaceae bacterium]
PTTTVPITTVPATVRVTDDWRSGFCAEVTVTNRGSGPWAWTVSVSAGGTVTTGWNARWSQQGATLVAAAPVWAPTLAPGASTTFGYCAIR